MKTNVPPEQEASAQGTSPECGASPALTKTQAARRRIIGATLGAPVIYTLPSGAAQAARSNLCEDNTGDGGSAIDPVSVQKVQDNDDAVTYEVTRPNNSTSDLICKLDANGECLYDNKKWVYNGTFPDDTNNPVDGGRLVTQSCWASMGNTTSLIGTNWSNLG